MKYIPDLFKDNKPVESSELVLVLGKYGWSETVESGMRILINTKGSKVCKIIEKGKKYQILDLSGNKLMDGNGQLSKSIEKLLTEYYFAKRVLKD